MIQNNVFAHLSIIFSLITYLLNQIIILLLLSTTLFLSIFKTEKSNMYIVDIELD